MKQYFNLKTITAICGFLAALSFFIKIVIDIIAFQPNGWHLLFGFTETSGSLSSILNHIFIIFTILFSGSLLNFCKKNNLTQFKEAAILYFAAYLTLFVRTFLFPVDLHSFAYVLSAGFQILLTLMSMFFFLISFINSRGYFVYAVLTAADMMIYFFSVLYSMFMTDFSLPNLGSITAAVLNICFMSVFVLTTKKESAQFG